LARGAARDFRWGIGRNRARHVAQIVCEIFQAEETIEKAASGVTPAGVTERYPKKMLKKGQRVHLNARGIRYATSNRIARPRAIDWKLRRGTVGHITRDRKRATVLWEGNTSLSDALPIIFLEAVDA
jgi:hypothetical protein